MNKYSYRLNQNRLYDIGLFKLLCVGSISLFCAGQYHLAHANIAESFKDYNVANGAATVALNNNVLTVTQTSNRAVINWHKLGVADGETLKFDMPQNGYLLNSVTGGQQTVISALAKISITNGGTVFISNPSGVLYQSQYSIDLGQLITSNLTIDPTKFMDGQLAVREGSDNPTYTDFNLNDVEQGAIYSLQFDLTSSPKSTKLTKVSLYNDKEEDNPFNPFEEPNTSPADGDNTDSSSTTNDGVTTIDPSAPKTEESNTLENPPTNENGASDGTTTDNSQISPEPTPEDRSLDLEDNKEVTNEVNEEVLKLIEDEIKEQPEKVENQPIIPKDDGIKEVDVSHKHATNVIDQASALDTKVKNTVPVEVKKNIAYLKSEQTVRIVESMNPNISTKVTAGKKRVPIAVITSPTSYKAEATGADFTSIVASINSYDENHAQTLVVDANGNISLGVTDAVVTTPAVKVAEVKAGKTTANATAKTIAKTTAKVTAKTAKTKVATKAKTAKTSLKSKLTTVTAYNSTQQLQQAVVSGKSTKAKLANSAKAETLAKKAQAKEAQIKDAQAKSQQLEKEIKEIRIVGRQIANDVIGSVSTNVIRGELNTEMVPDVINKLRNRVRQKVQETQNDGTTPVVTPVSIPASPTGWVFTPRLVG